jgi:hypothetical protein
VARNRARDGREDATIFVRHELGHDPDDALDFGAYLTSWMRDSLDTDRDAALGALRTTIAEHTSAGGVTHQSATWIIQAHKP